MSVRGSLRRACAWVLATAIVAAGLVLGQAPDAGAEESLPAVTVTGAEIVEGTGDLVFRLALSAPSDHHITVDLETIDRDATAPQDYVAIPLRTYDFPPGVTEVDVPVTIVDDGDVEDDELFEIFLRTVRGGRFGNSFGEGWIVDDDSPARVDLLDVEVNETDAVAHVPVRLNRPADVDVELDWSTTDGHAGSDDFVASWGTLTIPAGETTAAIDIALVDDAEAEPAEDFVVWVNRLVGAGWGRSRSDVTIVDDDPGNPFPTITIGDGEGVEDDLTIRFPLTLDKQPSYDISITWEVIADTATADDVSLGLLTTTLWHGSASWFVSAHVLDDGLVEGVERFTVALVDVTNATIDPAHDTAVGTIVDDDLDPWPALSIADATATEGDGATTFTVTLSTPATERIEVFLSTGDGTDSLRGATHAKDYRVVQTSRWVEPGQTSVTFTVPLVDDLVPEPTETFRALIDVLQGHATVADQRADGTIVDDDPFRLGSIL